MKKIGARDTCGLTQLLGNPKQADQKFKSSTGNIPRPCPVEEGEQEECSQLRQRG